MIVSLEISKQSTPLHHSLTLQRNNDASVVKPMLAHQKQWEKTP
jgi:hypothetical protein